jgi:hypothetical protein
MHTVLRGFGPSPRVRIGQALLAILVAFAALNLALVVVDFPTVESHAALHVKKVRYAGKSNVFREEGFSRFHVNSFGLIGDEPAPSTAPDVYRIAMFGDSFVEGYQVPEPDRMTALLQRDLSPPPGYRQVEVWNFGFSGDNTGNAFARWVYRPPGWRFSAAVFAFNDGDLFENTIDDAKRPFGAFLVDDGHGGFTLDESQIDSRIPSPHELQARSLFGRFFFAAYILKIRIRDAYAARVALLAARWNDVAHPLRARNPSAPARNVSARTVEDTCRQLLHVSSAIRAEIGAAVVLAGLPSAAVVPASNVEHDPALTAAYGELIRCLRGGGGQVADPTRNLTHAFLSGEDPYRDWNELDGHYNRLGHRIVATRIIETLRAQLPATHAAR